MHKFIIQETPAKVFSLLGVALFSLTFMLAVSTSEATFAGTTKPLSDPFGPSQVVAAVDSLAASYSSFAYGVLVNPTKEDFSEAVQGVAWVWDNTKQDLAYATGLDGLASGSRKASGAVAGAYTSVAWPETHASGRALSIDTLYNMLLQ